MGKNRNWTPWFTRKNCAMGYLRHFTPTTEYFRVFFLLQFWDLLSKRHWNLQIKI